MIFVGGHYYGSRDSLHHNSPPPPHHEGVDTNMDGTVSTSIVEDLMSLVQAMATVWHTYLLQFNTLNESKQVTNPSMAGHVRVKLTTSDQVHLFLRGMQHVLSTIRVHHRERCQQILSSLATTTTTTDPQVVAILCAHMNDSIHLAQAMETLVLIQPVPQMIQALQQQQQQAESRTTTIPESRHDHGSCHSPATVNNTDDVDDAVRSLQQATLDFGNDCRRDAAVTASEQLAVWVVQRQMMPQWWLFSYAWEVEYTNNEVCRQMIQQCLHPFLTKCQQYFVGRHGDNDVGDVSEEFSGTQRYLFHKVLIHTVRATVCWYVRCLIQTKADPVVAALRDPDPTEPHYYFEHPPRALRRMYDDIRILRKYFQSFCRDHVTLQRIVTDECATLELLHESLLCCHNEHLLQQQQQRQQPTQVSSTTTTPSSLESFIVVLHKRCTKGNALLTRYLVGDLYLIMSPPPPSSSRPRPRFRFSLPPSKERIVATTIQPALQQLQPDLLRVTSHLKHEQESRLSRTDCTAATSSSSFLQVHGMLQSVYEERISQGIVPWMCHSLLCLPLSLDDDDNTDQCNYNFATHPKETMVELFIHPIRTITRTWRR